MLWRIFLSNFFSSGCLSLQQPLHGASSKRCSIGQSHAHFVARRNGPCERKADVELFHSQAFTVLPFLMPCFLSEYVMCVSLCEHLLFNESGCSIRCHLCCIVTIMVKRLWCISLRQYLLNYPRATQNLSRLCRCGKLPCCVSDTAQSYRLVSAWKDFQNIKYIRNPYSDTDLMPTVHVSQMLFYRQNVDIYSQCFCMQAIA